MAIATISDVKLKLWKETTTAFEDQQIQFYLDSTEGLINSMFGDFNLSNKTESFSCCDFNWWFVYVSNPNPQSIITINGEAYAGVLWTDYYIDWRKLMINDLWNYPSVFPWIIEIVYSAGYSTLPKDIVYFHCLLVEWELAKEWGKEIASYRLWPRQVSYIDTPTNTSIMESIKSKYIIITV